MLVSGSVRFRRSPARASLLAELFQRLVEMVLVVGVALEYRSFQSSVLEGKADDRTLDSYHGPLYTTVLEGVLVRAELDEPVDCLVVSEPFHVRWRQRPGGQRFEHLHASQYVWLSQAPSAGVTKPFITSLNPVEGDARPR